jgi:hypothetical protein
MCYLHLRFHDHLPIQRFFANYELVRQRRLFLDNNYLGQWHVWLHAQNMIVDTLNGLRVPRQQALAFVNYWGQHQPSKVTVINHRIRGYVTHPEIPRGTVQNAFNCPYTEDPDAPMEDPEGI